AHDRMEQQDREEEVVDQGLHLLPDGAPEGGVAADQVTEQDEREIRKEQLQKVHARRLPCGSHIPRRLECNVVSGSPSPPSPWVPPRLPCWRRATRAAP